MLHIIKNQHIIDEVISYICVEKESNTQRSIDVVELGSVDTNSQSSTYVRNHILLVEEAVYLANPHHHSHCKLQNPIFSCFALKEDLQARGLIELVSGNIQIVDFNGFVDLTVRSQQSMTWE